MPASVWAHAAVRWADRPDVRGRGRMVLLHLDANKLKSSRRAPALLFFRCWLRINDDAGCGDGTITAKNCLFFALVACYIKKNCTFAS